MTYFILIPVVSFLLSLIFTPISKYFALKLNIIDKPTGLKKHSKPIPYLGGFAIFLASIPIVLAYLLINNIYSSDIIGILTSVTIILILGLWDDIKMLNPYTKLIIQILATIVLITSGVYIKIIYFPFWLNITLTILWILGITNAINLIDIKDGLAGSITFIASMTFFFIALGNNYQFIIMLSGGLAGAILGFLIFNYPPAKIFMGDAGSEFIGFLLAIISIQISYTTINKIALISPILILGIPIYDTIFVIIIRLLNRQNPLHGSPDHIAIRLNKLGIPDRYVLWIMILVEIVLCESAYIATTVNVYGAIFIYVFILMLALIFGVFLSKVKVK